MYSARTRRSTFPEGTFTQWYLKKDGGLRQGDPRGALESLPGGQGDTGFHTHDGFPTAEDT